jgi:hypothetical protein
MGDDDARPISDKALRLTALRTLFPEMRISLVPGRIDDSWPRKRNEGMMRFPDALASEQIYEVTGAAMNQAEREASENVTDQETFEIRQLRFELFRWPKERDTGFLAVAQYKFPEAWPALACPSIGLLAHIVKVGADWTVKERYLMETVHHSSIQSMRLLNLTGTGVDDLVIASNSGGPGAIQSELKVFDLRQGRFEELLDKDSREQYMTDDWYTQSLDVERTRESHGQQFCFTKRTRVEGGVIFRSVRVTQPCYKRDDDVDEKESAMRNKMLAPSR